MSRLSILYREEKVIVHKACSEVQVKADENMRFTDSTFLSIEHENHLN